MVRLQTRFLIMLFIKMSRLVGHVKKILLCKISHELRKENIPLVNVNFNQWNVFFSCYCEFFAQGKPEEVNFELRQTQYKIYISDT